MDGRRSDVLLEVILMISVETPFTSAMALLVVPKSIPKSIVDLLINIIVLIRGANYDFPHLNSFLVSAVYGRFNSVYHAFFL